MVENEMQNSVSDEDEDSNIINESGKRTLSSGNKDGRKRVKTKSLYRQPTANELNRLQETENLFNSNLFRLQIEEILEEVKVKEKTLKRFQEWFAEFKSYMQNISEDGIEYDLSDKAFIKKLKVKLPISKNLERTKAMFRFHKFNDIDIVGSYALGCSINSKLIVDLQITIPADTYNKNDSINYKYHKKRAAYLAYIASYLTKTEIIKEIKYMFLNGSETKPVILIKPADKLGNHLSVCLNLVCDPEAYKYHRFSPSRNNLRESWLFSLENQEHASEIGPPTPYYNSSVLYDLTASVNQEFLKKILIKSENLKQAIVLLKIWARQRNLQVSGFIISMLIGFLVQAKRINNIMSSYQIVRNVWIALKSSEWDTKGISLCKDTKTPSLEEFHQHFPIVFVDSTGYYNICGQMCKGTYSALKRESTLAIDMLDNGKINSFIPLFMTNLKPILQFDYILRFQNYSKVEESIINKAPKSARVNYGLDYLPLVTETLYDLLAKGLGDRVHLIQQFSDDDLTQPLDLKTLEYEKQENETNKDKLMFGFILNPDNAMKLVDRGPPANMPEAEEFRAFWGEKSELRRFQDGSITEACVWEVSQTDRRPICTYIVDYLLQFKYGIGSNQLVHVGPDLNNLLVRKSVGKSVEESSLEVLKAFDELRKDLRSLDKLPLEISAVNGISPVFSYCEPLPPLPCKGVKFIKKEPKYTPASRAIVELTHSGKWPGDLEAFRCLKAAFHLQISDRLSKQHALVTQAHDTHLDVMKNGLVFRLQVFHPKELTLLRRSVEGGVVRHRDGPESEALSEECVELPRLRGALHGLHQKYPAFGPAVCLLKRWVSSHQLAQHLEPTLLELLMAALFLRPEPYAPPAEPCVALLRALHALRDRDWSQEVVLVDFNDDMTKEEVGQLEQSCRVQGAGPCVATAWGWRARAVRGGAWRRARLLAERALPLLEGALMRRASPTGHIPSPQEGFIPDLKVYDVYLQLRERLVPHCRGPPREGPLAERMPVVEFNPVEKYLDELRSSYGDVAEFFYDVYGGDVVCVAWRPAAREPRDFQVLNANALKPVTVNGETKYIVNIDAILEDFRLLGKGLVTDVGTNDEHLPMS